MEAIDLTDLSDDQLVTLAAACCTEAVRRGAVTEAAVRDQLLSALERRQVTELASRLTADRARQVEAARVAREASARVQSEAERASRRAQADESRRAAEAERERQAAQWAKRAVIARRLAAVVGDGWTITVWRRDADRRVYAQHQDSRPGRYGGTEGKAISYYHTGTRDHPPGHLVTQALGRLAPAARAELATLLAEIAVSWSPGRLDCDAAVAAAPPDTAAAAAGA